VPDSFLEVAAALSRFSFEAYRQLVYETPHFSDYFFAATPIREIAGLKIGSRPAARPRQDGGELRIEDLRAIPWTFSWGQCRVALPGWAGFGTAVERHLGTAGPGRQRRLAMLRRMYREWPFFRTLLSNMDMVLAKSDLRIAARYAGLVEDRRLGKKLFSAIEAEWQRSSRALELITGESRRLAGNSALARSIEHRFPYLDPLNHLQVELIRRYRSRGEADPEAERVRTGIHISINGVAAGLRNTG
ncbi:MAG: phosphoenolpyruvate carboxylase, partial [Gammaproteobacteria bacterium]|nr:phosphoenolpyruvate carboxylase [Gammaproteobacteria bacterium]